MTQHCKSLKEDWEKRSTALGISKRSVLFKRFPGWLNNLIHRRHRDFILENIPEHFESVLDVGCGYGRLTSEIRKSYPNVQFSGIDLCTTFSNYYNENFGSCFNGRIEDFSPTTSFDMIIVVTLLMYVDHNSQVAQLDKLWHSLNPGGVLICIEPASEFQLFWKRLTSKNNASPTGGNVTYFTEETLHELLIDLPNSSVKSYKSISFFPPIPPLHHCFAIHKQA